MKIYEILRLHWNKGKNCLFKTRLDDSLFFLKNINPYSILSEAKYDNNDKILIGLILILDYTQTYDNIGDMFEDRGTSTIMTIRLLQKRL